MRSNNTINFADMPQGIYPRLRRPLSACLESTNSCDDSQLRQFRRTRSFSRMHPVDVKALTANKSLNKNEIKLMDRPRSLIDTGSTPSTSNSTIIAKNPKAQSLLSFDDRRESVNSVRNVKKISTASLDSIITFNQRKPLQLKKSSSLSSLSELEAEYDRTESVIEGSEVATGDFGGKNNRPKSAALTTRSNSTECSFDKEQIGQPRTGQKHADCPECSNTDVETKTSLTNNSNGRLSRSTICPKNEVTSNPNVGCKNVNINAARVESISAKNLNCGSGINSAEIGSMSDISSQFNEKRLHAKQKFTNCKDIYDPVSEKKDRSTKILCHKTENNVANSGIVPLNQTNYSDRFFHGDPLIERSFCLSEARLNESGKAPEIKPTKISGPNESSVCFSSTPNKPISFAQADNLSNGDAASGTTHIPSNSCHHNVLQSQVDESYLLDYESKSAEIRKKLTQKSFSSIQESNFLSSDDNSLKRASYPSARGPNEKVELIDPSWFKETNAYNNGPKQQSSLSNGINKAERKISFAAGYLNTEKTTYSDHAQAGKPRIKQEKLKFTEVAANAVGCRQNKKDRCMDVQFCDERLIMQDVTNTKLPPVQINTRCVRKRIDSGNLNVKSPISCGTFVKHGKFGSKKTEKQEEMNLYCNSVLTDSHISLEKEKAPRGGFTFFRKQFDKLTRWKRSASRKAPDLEEDENKRNVQNGIIYKDIDYFDEDDDEDENREEIKHDQQHVHGAKILCDFFVTDKKSVESGINDISVINGTIPKKNLSQEDEPLKDLIDEKYRDADLSSDPSTQISKNLCLFNAAEETSVHSLPDSISYRTEFKHRLGLALHSGSENTLTNVTDASLNTSQQHVNQLSEIDELSSFDSESQNTLFTLSSSDSTSVLTNYDSGDNMLQCPYFHDRSSTALSFHSYSSYDESSFLSSTTASSVTSVNASAEESDFHEALQKRRMERELQGMTSVLFFVNNMSCTDPLR